MVQIRPLRFMRINQAGKEPMPGSDGQLIYGLGQYLSADKCLAFIKTNGVQWRVTVTWLLDQQDQTVMPRLVDSGIFSTTFARLGDLIEAVEEILDLDNITEEAA